MSVNKVQGANFNSNLATNGVQNNALQPEKQVYSTKGVDQTTQLLASSHKRNANDAVYEISKQLKVTPQKLLDLGDPKKYDQNSKIVRAANNLAVKYGYSDLGQLSVKYLADKAFGKRAGEAQGERITAPDPNRPSYPAIYVKIEGWQSSALKHEAKRLGLTVHRGQIIIGQSEEDGRKFALLGSGVQPRFGFPMPRNVSPEFRRGYQQAANSRAISVVGEVSGGIAGAKKTSGGTPRPIRTEPK